MRDNSIDIFCFTPSIHRALLIRLFQCPGNKTIFRIGNNRLHVFPVHCFNPFNPLFHDLQQLFPRMIPLHEFQRLFISFQ